MNAGHNAVGTARPGSSAVLPDLCRALGETWQLLLCSGGIPALVPDFSYFFSYPHFSVRLHLYLGLFFFVKGF